MRDFDDLLAEAVAADVTGWGFGWLDGRATEERPPWGYARLLSQRLGSAHAALDLDTGGGEIVAEALAAAPARPARLSVTEAWPPNVEQAHTRLGPFGVEVRTPAADGRLPFADETFDVVSSRHPVAPNWPEIHRVLAPAGEYLAQHVGPASVFELIEYFRGPVPRDGLARDPRDEAAAARAAGLEVTELRTARCRTVFHDIGAVVWILRKCVWWVPDFDPQRDRELLLSLDAHLRTSGPFVAHSTRHLIRARRG